MTGTDIAHHLEARQTGDGRWIARCPNHDDRSPSLSIRQASDRVLLHCFAGCPAEEVVRAAGLTWDDLFLESRRPNTGVNLTPVKDTDLALRRKAALGLEKWARETGDFFRNELHISHRLESYAEKLAAAGDPEQSWDILHAAYRHRNYDEHILGLIDSHRPQDWLRAVRIIKRGIL